MLAKLAPGAEAVGKDVGEAGTEGEPCRLLYTRDKSVGAIIYPTAERLKDIEVRRRAFARAASPVPDTP